MSSTAPSVKSILVVLSNWSYPGQEGLHIQNGAVLQRLCQSGMRVHILAFVRAPATVDVARLRADWGPNLDITVSPIRVNYPLLLLQSLLLPSWLNPNWQAFQAMLTRVKPALIHLEGIGIAPWLGALTQQCVLMSAVDAWSLRQSRLAQRATGFKRLFLQGYAALSRLTEHRYYRLAAAVHVVSEEDAHYLRSVCPNANVQVVPVGLMSMPSPRPLQAATSPCLVFWGDLKVAYLRDGLLWLLTEVLPQLPEPQRSSLKLEVLGRREPDAQLLAAAGPQVTFTQWVDDVDKVLAGATVVVLPDASGSGMKNRTLHAMACGVPVVGTNFAFEGIAAPNDVACMVRDNAYGFAIALAQLLTDEGKAQAIGQAGRQLVLDRYSLDAVVEGWRALYTACGSKCGT